MFHLFKCHNLKEPYVIMIDVLRESPFQTVILLPKQCVMPQKNSVLCLENVF